MWLRGILSCQRDNRIQHRFGSLFDLRQRGEAGHPRQADKGCIGAGVPREGGGAGAGTGAGTSFPVCDARKA
jgi:hypothetical protein